MLIVGSGDIVHNLQAVDWSHINTMGAGYEWAYDFQEQINRAIHHQDQSVLTDIDKLGQSARLAVPTLEHYLPLLYTMAVRDADESTMLFNDVLVGGSLSMTCVKVG